MDIPNIKYGGVALFLLGVAYRLMRWVVGIITEDATLAGGDVDTSSALPGGHPLLAHPVASPAKPGQHGSSPFMAAAAAEAHTPWSTTDPEAPPPAGDLHLFSPAILDAMTPEQRAKVLASLMQQQAARSGH